MAILCPLLWLFAIYMPQLPVTLLLALLGLMGCLVGGPNNIITSAVATDLANDPGACGLPHQHLLIIFSTPPYLNTLNPLTYI